MANRMISKTKIKTRKKEVRNNRTKGMRKLTSRKKWIERSPRRRKRKKT